MFPQTNYSIKDAIDMFPWTFKGIGHSSFPLKQYGDRGSAGEESPVK